ncbi:acetate--CoA ligase family protein [Dactylosporangium roseum]|uniref:Acetate--CoA ligase family protein n=1 Tax=Dactylosporangium roseum TaxID=47989 RepID=A0ABY5ZEX2_9ACTN|nr:acetate--CoA ligase family protein [Dactylosporangium roseum]UWZ39198.1 acetate--CoA ligase family protein [Dactylosporangium roseum]
MFAPKGIAIVGASERSAWSWQTFGNLRRGNYPHEIHLVNPKGGEIHGQAAVQSLRAVEGRADLAVVLTGPESVPAIMDEAAAADVRNLVVIAAGFGEAGDEGARMERELAARARDLGLQILGPNNLGFINTVTSTYAWTSLMPASLTPGSVGIVSQSGALGIFLMNYLQSRDVPFSHLISVGNETMLTVAEGMDYLLSQDSTKVIALYLEAVRNKDLFIDAAERALAAGVPVVAYKAGRGAVGARVTAAHTGSLAGDDRVYSAVLAQHGVIRVDTIEDLVTTSGLLDAYGELPGHRVGFVTASGAMCGVIGDVSEENGLELPELDDSTVRALREGGLPDFATAQNPLDTTGYLTVNPAIMPMSQEAVARDPNIDILVIHGGVPATPEAAAMYSGGGGEQRKSIDEISPVPVIRMEFFPTERTEFARELRREGKAGFVADSFTRGIPALAKAIRWSELRRSRKSELPAVQPPRLDLDTSTQWSERQAVELLAGHGVPVVPQHLVTSADEAEARAASFDGPMVLKISSADVAHKTDVGGVALGLRTPAEVRAAYERMIADVRAAQPQAEIEGAVLSPMRPEGLDLVVGVVRDQVWGLTLVVGLGGVWVEVLRDSAIRVLPANTAEVRRMFTELKSFPLFEGFRGAPPVDLDHLAEVVSSIANVAAACGDRLEALEVNPLRVRGDKSEVLDALIRWV